MTSAPLRLFHRPLLLALWVTAALTLFRIAWVAVSPGPVLSTGALPEIIGLGLRYDLATVALLVGTPMLLLPWLHIGAGERAVPRSMLLALLAMSIAMVLFWELVTPLFLTLLGSRPDDLGLQVLLDDHLLHVPGPLGLAGLMTALVASSALGYGLYRWLSRDPASAENTTPGFCLLATLATALATAALLHFAPTNSGTEPTQTFPTSDRRVNSLAPNSTANLIRTALTRRKAVDEGRFPYGPLPDEEMRTIVLRDAGIAPAERLDDRVPGLHAQQARVSRRQPINLLILIPSGLGASAVGALGGESLTPELDQWRERSIWFERLYATGTSSARGLESILTGFTPSQALPVSRAAQAHEGFFTLASSLRQAGYTTVFIDDLDTVPGHQHRFLRANGFDSVMDGATGQASDSRGNPGEELPGTGFGTTLEHLNDSLESLDGPFFAVVRIAGRPVADADRAIGGFLRAAQQRDDWRNTLVLVVSDHDATALPAGVFSLDHFHVPAAIIGPMIRPRIVGGIASQIDLVPTLLSLLGLSTEHPAIGRDLLRLPDSDGAKRAMMQFGENNAYLEGDRLVMLRPDRKPRGYRIEPDGSVQPDPRLPPKLRRAALAHAKWGPYLLRKQGYRLGTDEEIARQ